MNSINSPASVQPPKPFGPIPSKRQLAWHALEYYGFVHFTVNTFTNLEWGFGDESPEIFAPTDFSASQIVQAAAQGGMAGLVLTCKHHDGFCLWPSEYTEHSVRSTNWRSGNADVVGEISRECEKAGIRFGVYLSPWDRNHPQYGTNEYIVYYRNQLRELLTRYGPLFEIWFDGANGGDGYYGGARETRKIDPKTYYEWEKTWAIVRELQPDACMFSDSGPDIRWVGNENGIAGDPCWHTIDSSRNVPGDANREFLNGGERKGPNWQPAECDVSIRPGWFYHTEEDGNVRSAGNLMDLYYQSVGRGAALHLNLPPDTRGRIHERDVESLLKFRVRRDTVFGNNLARNAVIIASDIRGRDAGASSETDIPYGPSNLTDGSSTTYWATNDAVRSPELDISFREETRFNVVELKEYLPLGQRVNRFRIEIMGDSGWEPYVEAEAVGNRRLVIGPDRKAGRIRVLFESAASPVLSGLGVYYDPDAQPDFGGA